MHIQVCFLVLAAVRIETHLLLYHHKEKASAESRS